MHNHHLQKSVGGIDPLGHDGLEEVLSCEFTISLSKLEVEGSENFVHEFNVSFHAGNAELADGVHDEGDEGALQWLALSILSFLEPFLVDGVKVVVTPELVHELVVVSLEFSSIETGEFGDSEGPAFFSGAESDGSERWVDLELAHIFLLIGGDNDVDHINDSDEILVHLFSVEFQFQNGTINLVDHHDGLDFLSHSLTKHGFGLHAHAFDGIDDDESTIGDSESGSDFR